MPVSRDIITTKVGSLPPVAELKSFKNQIQSLPPAPPQLFNQERTLTRQRNASHIID